MVRNYSFQNIKPRLLSDLVRIGNQKRDGGYVICERQVSKTKVLIGIGVNDDWSFEENFKEKQKDLSLYCYDFSVSSTIFLKDFISSAINVISLNSYTKEIFNGRSPHTVFTKPFKKLGTYFKFKSFFNPAKNNFFFQKGVSDTAEGVFITMKDVFANIKSFDSLPDDSVYVKMDIEESEYDILEDILSKKGKINGLAIEFHNLKHLWADFTRLIDKIKEDYEVVHVHGNNCCGYIAGTEIPNLVELSFIKRSLLSNGERDTINSKSYPLEGLDKPNFLNKPGLKISFE